MGKLKPFWKTKSLDDMTRAEWESLCDGCGRCCLMKYDVGPKEPMAYTDVACKLLDTDACRCNNYKQRSKIVKTCLVLEPELMKFSQWLPATCAYRLIHEGKDLYSWHPLKSGDPESVHAAGMSVRGRVVSELDVTEEEMEYRIVKWPNGRRRGP